MRYLLLAFLVGGPTHGYELKRRYDDQFGAVWGPVNIGQVYATMARFEQDGLVTASVDHSSARERKRYELTRSGRKYLDAWLMGDDVGPLAWKSDVVLRIAAAELTGDGAREVIDEHRRRSLQLIRDLERQPAAHDVIAALLVEGAVLHAEAELRWLDRCIEALTPGDDAR